MIEKLFIALACLFFLLVGCDQPPSTSRPTPTSYSNFVKLLDHRTVGEYDVYLWGDDLGLETKSANGDGRFTIDKNGEMLLTILTADQFRDEPVIDYTGEGNPDILLRLRNGASNCCVGMMLIDLGEEPVELLRVWSSVHGDGGLGEFEDLNGDGVYEFITKDAIEAPCTTPAVKVILQYTPESGFQPASPLFPEQYTEPIEFYTEQAEKEFTQDGGVHQCSISQLAASYYFSGRPEEAKAVFDKYYTAENAESYWSELVAGFQKTRFYTE